MDQTVWMEYFSRVLMAVALLVGVTNIIVEVLKSVFVKVKANYLAIGTAMILTLLAFAAWMACQELAFQWYYIMAALVMGMMVAYAAMFGFDKLKETLEGMKK